MWTEFIVALAAFLASHALPMRPGLRDRLLDRLGRRTYFTAYSAASIVLLVWLFSAAARAPAVWLWPPLYSAPFWGMPLVCWLLSEGLLHPNPLSLGRPGEGPHGLGPLTRHPLPLALTIWSGLHILANPALAQVILFGLLGAFSGLSMVLIDRRNSRTLGTTWQKMASGTACLNLCHIARVRPSWAGIGIAAALYVGLIFAHPFFSGVAIR